MYHTKSNAEIEKHMQTNIQTGLTNLQAEEHLQKFGPNKLEENNRNSALARFLAQFKDILVLVLLAAAAISYILGEKLDTYVILVIVILNAFMGFIQETKAEKAIEALKKLSSEKTKVLREGEVVLIAVEHVVPGDVIVLETGDKVPADLRLVETINLQISESLLTGESMPTKKDAEKILPENTLLGDRANCAFKDTTVVYGRGKAIVVATGKETEIGKISKMLKSETKEATPLSKELDKVGKRLSLAAGIIILLVFATNLLFSVQELSKQVYTESLLTAVSLAVAAIPEGLPAVVTIILAVGVSRLAKNRSVIRRLQAVETLGSTNYILTDKTGTLTQNVMHVTNIFTNNTHLERHPSSAFDKSNSAVQALLIAGALCNDSKISFKSGKLEYLGDPTETALVEVAHASGIDVQDLQKIYTRIYEIPFSSETKKMLVVLKNSNKPYELLVIAKGAPEIIGEMTTENTAVVLDIANGFAQEGLRNLAFSSKVISIQELEQAKAAQNPEDILSTYHRFLGVLAQKDPLRPEVKDALQMAKIAGVQTLMLTGDHKLTAINIAKELNLISSEQEALDGRELGDKSGAELEEILKTVKVFARVSPEQKLRIVQAIKSQDYIVAVTGDGVNDAPAIKASDIGISMGITGTDVSKEVSDMVLQDDNYATIVEAIKQGRIIYDNLIKFIKYLISCNMSEIFIVAGAVLMQLPAPLLPIHILWINLVTDGFPALALGMEPEEADIMNRKPRDRKHGILTKERWLMMSFEAVLISAGTMAVFMYTKSHFPLAVAQTATMTALAFAQLANAYNNRSQIHSMFSSKLMPNKNLLVTAVITVLVQLGIIYSTFGNTYLKTAFLKPELIALAAIAALVPIVGVEFFKWAMQKPNRERFLE